MLNVKTYLFLLVKEALYTQNLNRNADQDIED